LSKFLAFYLLLIHAIFLLLISNYRRWNKNTRTKAPRENGKIRIIKIRQYLAKKVLLFYCQKPIVFL